MKELIIAVFLALIVVAVMTATGMLGGDETQAQSREAISCPSGYVDCTGIPVSEPTPEPTSEPTFTVVVEIEPTPTETPFSCIHIHDYDSSWPDGEFIHYGYNHFNPNGAVGVFQSYNSERCGH